MNTHMHMYTHLKYYLICLYNTICTYDVFLVLTVWYWLNNLCVLWERLFIQLWGFERKWFPKGVAPLGGMALLQ